MTSTQHTALERAAAAKAGSPWFVLDTVHAPGTGEVLYIQAVRATDDPLFLFHEPADYPRLPAAVVEDANKRHRKAHRLYERTMLSYSFDYWNRLFNAEEWALKRMAIHRAAPWACGGVLIAGAGGYIVDALPASSGHPTVDWLGEMVVDLVRLRKEKDYITADALRREIVVGAGAHLFITKDGVEFINARDFG